MNMRSTPVIAGTVLLFLAVIQVLQASEYLGNNQRSGYTDAAVPTKPVLLWTYKAEKKANYTLPSTSLFMGG